MKNILVKAFLNTARKVYHSLPLAFNHQLAIKGIFYKNLGFLFSSTESYKLWKARQFLPYSQPFDKSIRQSLSTTDYYDDSLPNLHIPTDDNPTISIIIPVYGQIDYTLNCLRSLANTTSSFSFEVIIVDDCSPDDTQGRLKNIEGVRVLLNDNNLGFICSCNKGAKEARGKYLVFLNNDTQVLAGWLDSLIGTFFNFPTAGLVGSKLLCGDGRLQEAGGIIWNDGTGLNFGRYENPNLPEYNYVRDVDYCSGASIAIRRELFEQFGGFDERYIPAYYEDTDLAFAVREAGYKVLYQPASQLIHFEGITSGTDIDTGAKSYQAANRLKFLEKWGESLARHEKPGASVFFERDRRVRGRILIIDETTPTPDQDSGSLDAFFVQRTLIELSYKVTFIPEDLVFIDGYTQQFQRIGVECLYLPFIPTLQHYLKANGNAFDFVILNRANAAFRNYKKIRLHCPQARIIFNTVDLHHLRQEREAALTGSAEMARQAKRLKDIEFELMRQCDMTIVISEVEAALLHSQDPDLRLTVMPFMREIPGCRHPFSERKDIVFIGGFDHAPNVDAVGYFVNEIWPLVRVSLPEAQFLIIGSKINDGIKALESHEGVVVVGYVEDLADYFDYCKLTVAPLRFGAGIKGKIGTSASFGVPSVATRIAVEGMGFVHGEHILVADDPATFAGLVVDLYQNEPLWLSLSQSSLGRINEQYSLAAGKRRLAALLDGMGGKSAGLGRPASSPFASDALSA
jgi:GT2 family glycosyltransferase